ncbi:MAG: hypothetical protein COY49_05475 [Comamonadaceae bacterium CG_4_10_14_0_8_um_filter_57_29]|nr:MAG: hypothetical protein COY49_05475 [Comamonadaceae bacterium CG_4_10_14_0_8_um_filter_57_29]
MKPLRAFLFSCAPSGEWSSSAFRELEPLLEATKAALATESASAAIHVGFWRPETAKVAELTQKWSGTLLLSDAAIGSLPPPLSVSHASVGEVESLSFRVALDGFGYTIDDPSPGMPKKRPTIQPSVADRTFVARGWVEHLIAEKPELDSLLRTAGIWDEKSYHEKEASLSIDERVSLAYDRFRMVVGAKANQTNILDNLHACPNWFLNFELRLLDMTVRTRNVCTAYNLVTIGDLASKGYSGLLKLANMGQGSVHGLSVLLWETFINGGALKRKRWPGSDEPTDDPHYVRLPDLVDFKLPAAPVAAPIPVEAPEPVIESVFDGFLDAAQALTEQERHIWTARLGFRCPQQTLQVTAEQIGITRERVRQIEVKIYRKVGHNAFWKQLKEKLSDHLNDRTSPLLLNGISAVDPWFKGVDELKVPLREVFNHVLHDEFSILDLGDTPVITRLPLNQWERAVNSGKALLREMVNEHVSEDYARVQIGALLVDRGADLRDELWGTVRPFAMWATNPEGKSTLIGYGRTAEMVVAAVLQSAGHPLHYEEIYRRAKLISEKEHDERRIHHAAQSVAVLFNRGTYGLLSHCPLTPKELALIEAEVEDIAAGAEPTKQWHTSELLDELLERGFDFDGKLTKYIINIALRNSKTFSNMRRMVWGYKEAWQASAASRLDMRQAVMALLEEAGRPLSTLEIKERLEGDRGVNNHFQIHPQGNLIRMGSGLWGLANRDVNVNDPQALLDQLVNHLQNTQEGIHSSEVAEILGDIDEEDAQALLGLIKQKGMRRDRAQYVYLSSWSDSRRIWPSRAIEQTLDDHPDGMTIEEVRLEVKRLTKRDLNGLSVGNMLFHTEGAFYNPDTELWKREISANVDSDEEETDSQDEEETS